MKMRIAVVLVGLSLPVSSHAWGNKGHEIVAYVAYQHLDAATRKEVDYLVTLNPCYGEWQKVVASLAAGDQPVGLFMLSATWPDRIKSPMGAPYTCQPGHKFIFDGVKGDGVKPNEDVPPNIPEASQNIGYGDTRRHKYWHFVDTPFSTDGTPVKPASVPNALTELLVLSAALKSDEGDDLKSYDMAWVEHLTGDLNQPLHDATRFTAAHPDGDAGGNLVSVCVTAGCTPELHGYWDDLPGPGNDLAASITMGKQVDAAQTFDDETVNVEDPGAWASEGFQLAKTVVYTPPISQDGKGSVGASPDKAYAAKARATVQRQLGLAGYRLAAILTDYLT